MKDHVYLVVTKGGVDRMAKTDNFILKPGERAFRLTVEIADEAFRPARIPTVYLHVPAEAMTTEIVAELDGGAA